MASKFANYFSNWKELSYPNLTEYVINFCFSVLLALRLPRLGKRELILVLFVGLLDLPLFGFCLFSLPLGVCEGLRFVIVAHPGFFSYFLLYHSYKKQKEKNVRTWNTTKN